MTFIDTLVREFRESHYEPVPSTREMSVREMRGGRPRHIKHRFPFPGGVPFAAVLATNVMQKNPLFERWLRRCPASKTL